MKKIILITLLSAIFFSDASAQIEKGSTLIGGNAGFQFRRSDNTYKSTSYTFSLSPTALYHPIKYIGIGGQFFYSHNYTKFELSPETQVSSDNFITIGPALRVNIPISQKAFLFIHHGFNGGVEIRRDPTNSDKAYGYSSIINWRFGPGFSVFATKNVAIEFGFFYDGSKEVAAIKQNSSVLLKGDAVFTHGLTVAVGLQFYVHKKQKTVPQTQ